ncbi:MAG: DHH family phosphoesterase [Nanoarchaeota archaeon]
MIELTKPDFIAGDENKFVDFIKKIDKNDKVALVSHVADLDGVISAKIVNEILNPEIIRFADYHEINKNFALELKKQNSKIVIITDLMIRDVEFVKEIEKFAKLLIIDHHVFEIDFNSEKTLFFNSDGFCAAYLSYYLFSKIQNLEKYDWLVAAASVSDWTYKKNGSWMTAIYEKYKQNYISDIDGIKKSKIYDIVLYLSRAIVYFRAKENDVKTVFNKIECGKFGYISDLEKYAKIVAKEIKRILNNFEKEKIIFNDGFYYEFETNFPIKSIISTQLSEMYLNKTVIIASKKDNYLTLSARRQDGKVDTNKLMQKMIQGLSDASAGGHFKATGGYILFEDAEEFKKRLQNL